MNQENVLTDMSNTEEDSSSRSSITDVNKPSLLVDCSTGKTEILNYLYHNITFRSSIRTF